MSAKSTINYPDAVRAAVEEHCFSRLDVEVGGFLIGTVTETGTDISHAHPASAVEATQTNLTFTHEAWDDVLTTVDASHPGLSIVGWYHSHPGFGVFLSDYDTFIQQNFFSGDGQVALVVDPVAGEFGFLVAPDGTSVTLSTGATARAAVASPGASKVDAIAAASPMPAKAGVRWPVVVSAAVVVGVLGALAGWFVGGTQGQDQARTEAVARIQALEGQLADAMQPTPTPTPSATPTPTPSPSPSTIPSTAPALVPGDPVQVTIAYTIRPGDTFWSVSRRFLGDGERYPELMAANPLIDPDQLDTGQVIIVPVGASFVASGGTP